MLFIYEDIDLDKYPVGTVFWARIPFVDDGPHHPASKRRPVIVVEQFENGTIDVVPVVEYSEATNVSTPRMGTVNAVIVTSYKDSSARSLNKYDVDLSKHKGKEIKKPSKAVCDLIFNIGNKPVDKPRDMIEDDLMDKILYNYDYAIKHGCKVYNI